MRWSQIQYMTKLGSPLPRLAYLSDNIHPSLNAYFEILLRDRGHDMHFTKTIS